MHGNGHEPVNGNGIEHLYASANADDSSAEESERSGRLRRLFSKSGD